MAGETNHKTYSLDEILTEKQIDIIISKSLGNSHKGKLVRSELKPASDGIAGFLGEHIKGALYFKADEEIVIVNIFIKRLPAKNKPKADFIAQNGYYERERLMFSLFEEFKESDSNSWSPKAYIYTDTLLVLPDLTVQGYVSRHYLDALDLPHVLLTTTSLARFHAAYANYETKKSVNGVPYNILNDFGHLMIEPTFKDSPWLRSAAKLTADFLETFSSKYKYIIDLQNILTILYIEACDSLKDYEESVNVLLHKDLWMNNIMFKYEKDVPVNAILVDFQCLRYGPPTFDLMIFLYLTTSRNFREKHEEEIIRHYYKIFCDALDDDTKERIRLLGYDKQEFVDWCDRSRMFGMLQTITIFPFVLMDPKTAEKTFDDPDTYEKYIYEDRTEPVIAHAMKCRAYRDRQLEVCEEFIERFMLKRRPRLISED